MRLRYRIFSLFVMMVLPFISWAQDQEVVAEAKGIDDKINDSFMPIASAWESFVLSPVHVGGNKIPIVLILLVSGALFFTLYFGFIQFAKFKLSLNVVSGDFDDIDDEPIIEQVAGVLSGKPIEKPMVEVVDGDIVGTIKDESQHGEVSHFQALATAVSGTVGLGNISGVAVAIALGGPGATFWMIVCGILGMATKFVECTLSVTYRDVEKDGTVFGGPMYYMSRGLQGTKLSFLGKVLAGIFAVMCVGASFGGGNAFQSNQATQQLATMFNLQGGAWGFTIGILLAIIVAVVIIGGIKSIAKVTERIVPFMAILYVIACLIIIFANIKFVGVAFSQIFQGAFTPMAGLGGILGVLIVGFQRAAFSNEAGAGSAAIAHSAVKTKFPASEGLVALLEPFIDTVVICTMTALVIIFFNLPHEGQAIFDYGNLDANNNVVLNQPLSDGTAVLGGVDLTSQAFKSVIPFFPVILTIAIVLFAFSTMISWSYYGLQSWKYLFGRGKTADIVYKVLFLIFVVIGASVTLDAVIKFSDAMILALVFPNMIGLLLLFPKVRAELKKYLSAITASKKEEAKQ